MYPRIKLPERAKESKDEGRNMLKLSQYLVGVIIMRLAVKNITYLQDVDTAGELYAN
jgi:hypothetical protein